MIKDKIKLSKTSVIILVVAVLIAICTITNGTYAWLSGKTKILNSSFTYGDIKISINDDDSNDYEIMPGTKITKNTNIKVAAKSEDCWLYIKIDKSDNFDEFMTYELIDGWTVLEGENNVYYREVSKLSTDQYFNIIKNNEIMVKPELTKQMIDSIQNNYPTFTVTAYAVQRDSKIDALDSASKAWLLVNNQE